MHWKLQNCSTHNQKHDHLSSYELANKLDIEYFDYPFKRIWGLIIYLGDRIIVGFQACLPDLEKKAILKAEMEYQKTRPLLDPDEPSTHLEDEDILNACEESIKEIVENALIEEAKPYTKASAVLRIRAK